MKRDMDLARRILLAIEDAEDGAFTSIKLPTEEYGDLVISHHIRLLKEANLIHAIETKGYTSSAANWVPHSLTWKGHDFLDAVRDDAIWRKIIAKQTMVGADLPYEFIHQLAIDELRRKVGMSLLPVRTDQIRPRPAGPASPPARATAGDRA